MDERDVTEEPQRVSGLDIRGNRIALAVVVGWLAWLLTGRASYWVIPLAAVVTYVLLTEWRKRR